MAAKESTATQLVLARARTMAANAAKRVGATAEEYGKKLANTRKQAKSDARSARIMTAVEVPVGGVAAAILDNYTDDIKGMIPYSLPAGIVMGGLGLYLDQGDLINGGSGMLAGSLYGLTSRGLALLPSIDI